MESLPYGEIVRPESLTYGNVLMQPALARLIVLSTKGALRRSFRGAKTVRGALLLAFSFVVIAIMVVPSLVVRHSVRGKPGIPPFGDWLEPYLPFMVLSACLLIVFTSAVEKAFYFTPAEVDLLFPAPFHRRDLLFYKLAKTIAGSLLLSIFLSVTSLDLLPVVCRGARWHLARAFVHPTDRHRDCPVGPDRRRAGIHLDQKIDPAGDRPAFPGGACRGLFAGPRSKPRASWRECFGRPGRGRSCWHHSWYSARRSWPAAVFPTWPSGAQPAAAIDLGLLALAVRLDADYLESAAAVSQKLYERVQRADKEAACHGRIRQGQTIRTAAASLARAESVP